MHKTYSSTSTEKYIAFGFALLIFIGACLLLVLNEMSGKHIAFIDAIFMATSAICVTGLGTVNFGTDLSGAAQVALVVLIQIGGVGVMSAAAAMMLVAGKRLGFRDRLFVSGGLGLSGPQGVVRLLRHVFLYTLAFELAGAIVIFLSLIQNGFHALTALRHSVCLAVSSFCNAGFTLFQNNLEWFENMYVVPGTVMTLIIIGGIGFPVMLELKGLRLNKWRKRTGLPCTGRLFLSLHARVALVTTAVLVLGGAVAIFLTEHNHAFADITLPHAIMNSLFGSVTARTAGFDTVPYTQWSREGLIITMCLMAIGACPSSTGGGMKTTTFVIILWFAWTEFRQKDNTTFFNRSIPDSMLRKATSVVLIYVGLILVATFLLTFTERMPTSVLLFETISALSTVGLTVDVTPHLSTTGKTIIIMLMYFGRVGLLTLATSIIPSDPKSDVRRPPANLLV